MGKAKTKTRAAKPGVDLKFYSEQLTLDVDDIAVALRLIEGNVSNTQDVSDFIQKAIEGVEMIRTTVDMMRTQGDGASFFARKKEV